MFALLAFGLVRFMTGTMPEYTPPTAWLPQGTAEPLGCS